MGEIDDPRDYDGWLVRTLGSAIDFFTKEPAGATSLKLIPQQQIPTVRNTRMKR